MRNEFESARKRKKQREKKPAPSPNPTEALEVLFLVWAPKALEAALEEAEEEIIQAERDQKRRRERLALLAVQPVLSSILDEIRRRRYPSPSA